MRADFSDLPDGWWSEAETIEAMVRIVAATIDTWAERLFLSISEAFETDASTELQDWAIAVVDATTLNLIADTERLADELGLSNDRRRRLIEERVGACRARLNELAYAFSARGHA